MKIERKYLILIFIPFFIFYCFPPHVYAITDTSDNWLNQANILFNLGRYQEALDTTNKALSINPDNASAWNLKGASLSMLGRYQDALDAYDKAVSIDKNSTLIWVNRAITLNNFGRHQEALDAADKTLSIDPNYADAWSQRGVALYFLNRDQEALDAMNKALSFNPNDAFAWGYKGNALASLGKYQEALDAYNKSLSIDPNNSLVQTNKEAVLSKLGSNQGTGSNATAVIIILGLISIGISYFAYTKYIRKPVIQEPSPRVSPIIRPPKQSIHDVFISYAHDDKLVADAICAKLEEYKIRCWIAPRDIAPGDNYASALVNAIDNSEIIVVVFSSKADKSPHVRNEVERAFNKEKIIIPFRIENIDPCDEMQYFMGSRHWLDALTPPLEDHIHNLIKILKTNLKKNTDLTFNNNLKNTIHEKEIVIKSENRIYCPKIYRFVSYVIDLSIGFIFGFILYAILYVVLIAFLGTSFDNLMYSSPGVNSRLFNSFISFCLLGGIIFWVIIVDNYKNIPIAGKKLLKITILQTTEKTNIKRWLFIRVTIKVIPIFVWLIGYNIDYGNSIYIGITLQIVLAVPMFFTARSQSVHDLIAGTVVCRARH